MSIATQITRLNNNIEAMKNTKQQIKDAVNHDFDIIANEQIENYDTLIENGLELYKQYIPPVETNQATELQVTDAMKCNSNKLEIFGNTSQDSYQGYNLVDVSPYQEETKNGVTLSKDSEGNIILNGTATSAFGWNVSLPETRVLPAGTYTKSITKDSNIGTYLTVSIGYNGSSISGTSIQPSRGINSMPLEQDTSFDQIRMYISNGTTFNNYKLSYMILSGEYTAQTIPPYEPYVGGVPSPNPDYPQDIHVVTGSNTIKRDSKNFYNATKTEATTRGTTWSGDKQYMYFNGTATSAGSLDFPIIPLKKGTYKIMFELVSGSITSTSDSALFYVYGTTSTSVIRLSNNQKTNSRTFTLSKDGSMYIHLWARTTETFTNAKIAYQVVKGDTADYDFEPYTHRDYYLDLGGKNIFNKDVETKQAYPIGAVGQEVTYNNSSATISYINCCYVEANKTYTISWKQTDTPKSTNVREGRIVDSNNIVLSIFNSWGSTITERTITPSVSGYIILAMDLGATEIQIEKGSTATRYSHYMATSLELCKIGNYQDYLYKENGNWYKYEILQKHEFTTGHSWPSASGNNYYWRFTPTPKYSKGYMKGYIYDNRVSGFNNMPDYHFGFENSGVFHIKNLSANDREAMRDILVNANEVLYYVKATPTFTQITDETLISQLDAIYEHLALVKGTNNITVTASDLAPYMKLSYKNYELTSNE